MQRVPRLGRYDTLVIDEAYGRSLNIEFLLGHLKRIMPNRPDLKLIVTSATIDVDGFSRHFNDAPIIEVSGRSYPVETHYLERDQGAEVGVEAQIVSVDGGIDGGQFGPRGDVLVFLPGGRDIREQPKTLRQQTEVAILPLYPRLSNTYQNSGC